MAWVTWMPAWTRKRQMKIIASCLFRKDSRISPSTLIRPLFGAISSLRRTKEATVKTTSVKADSLNVMGIPTIPTMTAPTRAVYQHFIHLLSALRRRL